MRVSIVYQGRVQGVGFRATARSVVLGRSTGASPLSGWVRNEPDGTVQMELQGKPAAIEEALAELREIMGRHITGTHRSEIGEVCGEHRFEIAG